MGTVLVVSITLVGCTGIKVGVWAIGSLVLMVTVGFPGSGTGPLIGGAILSVLGAIDGEVGVGTMRVGGSWGAAVGGSTPITGVGVA